jgi:hypothetical protein
MGKVYFNPAGWFYNLKISPRKMDVDILEGQILMQERDVKL